VAYGVTARAAKAVHQALESEGVPLSLLILKTLWPVPEELIREKAKRVKRVVVVEMNTGQYVKEIARVLPDKHVDFFGQMDGRLISPNQIREVIRDG
jgi:2-oxoglutarate ferredoxin oxidoreductase subunit alpha